VNAIIARSRRYAAATRALCENGIAEYAAGVRSETPEYLALNREAAESECGVPRPLRALIDRRIVRRLDYFARTGGTG
jgi:hypothetical protein